MTKYDEIMEKITLSPEAKERIIDSIADELSSEKSFGTVSGVKNRRSSWKKYLTAAACCLIVVAGVKTAVDSGMIRMGSAGSSPDMQYEQNLAVQSEAAEEEADAGGPAADSAMDDTVGASGDEKSAEMVWDVQTFESAEDLSEYLGFSAECPEFSRISKDEGLEEVNFRAYGDGMAEVTYGNGETENYFRKAVGTDDISGDYNVYDFILEFDGEKVSGELKGDRADDFSLAVWTDIYGYTYAAYIDGGISSEDWNKLIESCTGQDKG